MSSSGRLLLQPKANIKSHVNVYIVDDELLICQSLSNLINLFDDLSVIGYSLNANNAMREIEKTKPDIIFIDIKLKYANGIDLISEIKKINPDVKIIVLSGFINENLISKAVLAGASGYLTKSITIDLVKEAVNSILTSNKFYIPSSFDIDIDDIILKSKFFPQTSKLSSREKDVLNLFINEFSTKKIADKLGISEKTVRNHKANIMQKLNLENDVALIKYTLMMEY